MKLKPNREFFSFRVSTPSSERTSYRLAQLTVGQCRIQRELNVSIEAGTSAQCLVRLICTDRFIVQQEQVEVFQVICGALVESFEFLESLRIK